MKRKILNVLFALLFLTGFAILTYPTISDQWNTFRQSRLISDYQEVVSQMEEEDFEEVWAAARGYNQTFEQNSILSDAFGIDEAEHIEDTEYWKVLNVAGDGVMGHLNGTRLPVGGESNHTVLSAHRGLPSAKLFTDIDQLEPGDLFYLHILNEDLAYEVDRILPMVDKDDYDALEEALKIEEGKDQVTLFTCTPYGVNSHRLLVRGHRVPYNGELDTAPTPAESMVQAIQNYYMLYLLLGVSVTALVIFLLWRIIGRKK
jgi:sortase A